MFGRKKTTKSTAPKSTAKQTKVPAGKTTARKEQTVMPAVLTQAEINKTRRNFAEVLKELISGDARNLAFKKPMSFYREHSAEEAIRLLKEEAKPTAKKPSAKSEAKPAAKSKRK